MDFGFDEQQQQELNLRVTASNAKMPSEELINRSVPSKRKWRRKAL